MDQDDESLLPAFGLGWVLRIGAAFLLAAVVSWEAAAGFAAERCTVVSRADPFTCELTAKCESGATVQGSLRFRSGRRSRRCAREGEVGVTSPLWLGDPLRADDPFAYYAWSFWAGLGAVGAFAVASKLDPIRRRPRGPR